MLSESDKRIRDALKQTEPYFRMSYDDVLTKLLTDVVKKNPDLTIANVITCINPQTGAFEVYENNSDAFKEIPDIRDGVVITTFKNEDGSVSVLDVSDIGEEDE